MRTLWCSCLGLANPRRGGMDMSQDSDTQTLSQLDTENRQLRDTIVAMRETLERQQVACDERVQQARAEGSDEVLQLRATVQAVRDEMEARQQEFGERLQAEKQAGQAREQQLMDTVQILRDRLESCDAK